jgi:DNA-binding NarL/FixJ family response regulator
MLDNAATESFPPASVLVVDDDQLCVAALVLLLSEDGRVAVVDRARNGAEGVELALRLEPDVVLMDVQMPVMDGFEATRRILQRLSGTRVVLISGQNDADAPDRARLVGASAFLRKGCDVDELLDAVAGASRIPERAA